MKSKKKKGEVDDKEKATEKSKPKKKRTSKNQTQKVFPYFGNNYEKKTVIVEECICESDFQSTILISAYENIIQEKGAENGDEIAI